MDEENQLQFTNADELDTGKRASSYNTNKFPIEGEGISGTKDKNWLAISDHSASSHVKNLQGKVKQEKKPIGIAITTTEKLREIYLKDIYVLEPNHEFRCPRCNVSIDKVVLCTTNKPPPPPPPSSSSASSSSSSTSPPPPPICSACFGILVEKGTECFSGCLGNNKGWEVLKSFVYGGLTELLASLCVVTSSASADANTLNIVVLSIANLIGGLILLIHNLRDLKNTQPREEETKTEAPVDKYYESLGKREHFYLHTFVAVLSFLIFGLLPPVVYGFSFRESEDKDFKLAAVGGASLIGIILLALAEAHAQWRKPDSNRFVIYFKTVSYYVTLGVFAWLLTYVAGAALKRLVEQHGWFEPQPAINGGIANAMSFPIAMNNKVLGY